MSANTHTAGPWEVLDGNRVSVTLPCADVEASGYVSACIAITHSSEPRVDKVANARRIVACVNACEGLSSEALERLGTLDRANVAAQARRNEELTRLHEVNAELLEALKWAMSRIEKKARYEAIEGDGELYAFAAALGSIAKAGGEQA